MEDSTYYRIDWCAQSKLRRSFVSIMVISIAVVLVQSPSVKGWLDLTLQIILGALGFFLILTTFIRNNFEGEDKILLLTDVGRLTLINAQGRSQNLNVIVGNKVLFHCLVLHYRDVVTQKASKLVIFSDQVNEQDWRRLRRIALRKNAN